MSERIEAYLSELDRRLVRRVPEPRRSELVAELRSHLHLQAKDTDELGALTVMGPVRLVAEDLIRSESGVDTRSVWKLAAVPLVWFLLYLLMPLVAPFLGLGNQSLFAVYEFSVPFSQVGIAVFGLAVWRSKRWLVVPMGALFALFIVSSIGVIASRVNQPTPAEIMGQKVLAGDLTAAKVDGGARGYLAPRMHDPTMMTEFNIYGVRIRLPGDPHLAPVVSAERALQLWREDGEAYLRYNSRSGAMARRVMESAVLLPLNVAIFAAINGLVLLADAGRRRRIVAKSQVAPA